ncbi:hypothetical protein KIW84_054274 [Lathyrus oleraceus]|uniref:Reverse transcriptase n=1 Tax=Pisum sativum TaxID=3888 RepID=A0A9D5AHZ0_PEA|nr:hypothetical protein KIW84_054274 [Pisum sativum]
MHYLVSDAEDELNLVQAKIQFDGYSYNLSTMEKDCMNKLEEALQNEHLFWKEKAKVFFNLNKDGTPGLDGFCAFFFQHFWDIIHQDVIMDVKKIFISSWIMPNYDGNTLILLPKVPNVDYIELFRPIALANFKFKIISKVLKQFGFHDTFTKWIWNTLSSSKISIFFNGRVDIPLDSILDSKAWINPTSGDLTLKDAHNFKSDSSSYFS